MRLSGWVEIAPRPEAVAPKVLAVVEPMLSMLGCEPDPPCWVVWGDDPGARYTILAATAVGLVQVNARVNVPGEGPRAGGKLVRWSRAQVGDLAIEMQGGHRILRQADLPPAASRAASTKAVALGPSKAKGASS